MLRGSQSGDLAHGIMEGETEDLGEEVDGVARFVVSGPAPVGVLEQETRVIGGFEVAGVVFDESEAAFFEQRAQGRLPCATDLFAGPSWSCGGFGRKERFHGISRGALRLLFSSEAGGGPG